MHVVMFIDYGKITLLKLPDEYVDLFRSMCDASAGGWDITYGEPIDSQLDELLAKTRPLTEDEMKEVKFVSEFDDSSKIARTGDLTEIFEPHDGSPIYPNRLYVFFN